MGPCSFLSIFVLNENFAEMSKFILRFTDELKSEECGIADNSFFPFRLRLLCLYPLNIVCQA